ncbi:MAG: PKD domain-containing protein [Burkholderiales bacterium]|nr:PKD domain-containing protein [Bacteroidia bacterium]
MIGQSIPNNNLKLWLKADSGIVKNSSNKVLTWSDISGNNNNLHSLPGSEPLIQNSIEINNLPTIQFSGTSSLIFDATFSIDSFTVFYIAKKNAAANRLIIFGDITTQTGIFNWDDGFTYIQTPSTYAGLNTGAQTDYSAYLIKFNKLTASVFKDGSQTATTTPFVYNGLFNFNQLGESNFYSSGTVGEIAEIIVYNGILKVSEINQIEQYIFNKYAPPISLPNNITVANSYCDTIISPIGYFTNYAWSTGATTPSIAVNKSGKYWVNATNIFGKLSSDTILVTYPNYHQPLQNVICANKNLAWDTELPKSSFSFQWQDNSPDSVFAITQAGNYYVKITDSLGCSITSDTLKITVDTFANTMSLGNDTFLCSGNLITLTSGASPSLTYTWSTGSNNDSLLITTTGQYSVVVTNTNNCVARDTIIVNISGQAPVANFSTSIGCQNTAVSFTNLSSAVAGNTIIATNWNFGDVASGTFSTSAATNPFHTFSDTGTYTIRLKVITNAGCEQSITKTIHIAPKPTVNFSIGNSCQNDSTSFSNLSTSNAGYPLSSLNWNFGDSSSGLANNSNSQNPKHLFSTQSNYTIKLVATNNAGCKDSLINIITVKAQVKAGFTYSTPCTNTTTVFQDNSIASSTAPSTRLWNFGNSTSAGLTVAKAYATSGVYSVSLTVTVNGCTSNISKIITIFSPPVPNFTIPASCLKDTITAINSSMAQSGVISSYNWKLNNLPFSAVQNPTLSLSSAGSYPVRLTVVNSFGCKDSITKTITVYPLPIVDFTTNPATYYYINSPVNFIPSILNASSYVWSGSSISTSTVQSPSYTFNAQGTYTVTLNLKDLQGCRNLKTKTLLVSKPYLDVAILNVTTIKDDDGFMTVKTDLANYGTIPVSAIDLQYQISDGGNNKETWAGTLIPNAFFTYTFNSKSASQANSTNNITCVDIKKVNGINDDNQTNNNLCSTLSYNEIAVSNPIPNPAEGDITLPVILNKNIEINITIYNSNGQLLYEAAPQRGIEGLNLIILPTSSYSRGCYIIKTVIDDKVFIKKFIKISNK